jgi:hypothetical protein
VHRGDDDAHPALADLALDPVLARDEVADLDLGAARVAHSMPLVSFAGKTVSVADRRTIIGE